MKTEWFKEYSECLLRDMEFKVYGHSGTPILVFPDKMEDSLTLKILVWCIQ